jgi:hypothetical protein
VKLAGVKLREAVLHDGRMVDRFASTATITATEHGVMIDGTVLVPWGGVRWCELAPGADLDALARRAATDPVVKNVTARRK